MQSPRVRDASGRNRFTPLLWAVPTLLVAAIVIVLAAQWVRSLPVVQDFVETHPGVVELPDGAPVGFPAWLAWQHFLNSFFILFILRTALILRAKQRPDAFYTRRNTGLIRTTGSPVRIGLPLWLHLSVDALWVLNGVIYVVLLFATGQWVRVVPTDWAIVPNAVSAALQYASLDWPSENGWINYNALQVLAYFATIFVAAPLALVTGIRLSPGLAARLKPLDRAVPLAATRLVHTATLVWFCAFIVVHVGLVLTTGAIRNLNHLYALRDDESPIGLIVWLASLVVMAIAWFGMRPRVLDWLAGLTGDVRRLPK